MLGEWKDGWDDCRDIIPKLRSEIGLIFGEKAKVLWRSKVQAKKADLEKLFQVIKIATVKVVWVALLANLTGEKFSIAGDFQYGEDVSAIQKKEGDSESKTSPDFLNDIDIVLRPIAESMMDELTRSDNVHQLDSHLRRMARIHHELEEKLNPLVLRPLILSTRCRVCPV